MATNIRDGRDRLTEARREAFTAAQAVTRDEHTADLMVASVEAQKRGFAAMMDGIEFAEKYDASNPLKARLIAAYQAGLLQLTAALSSVQEPEALMNAPFSGSLEGSSPSSPQPSMTGLPEGLTPKGLPHENRSDSQPEEPARRGRGRPLGSRNRPRPDGQNGKP